MSIDYNICSLIIIRTIEIRGADEIDEQIRNETETNYSSASNSNNNSLGFAKPMRPGRGRPKLNNTTALPIVATVPSEI